MESCLSKDHKTEQTFAHKDTHMQAVPVQAVSLVQLHTRVGGRGAIPSVQQGLKFIKVMLVLYPEISQG